MRRRLARAALLAALLPVGGCSALGGAASGLTGMIGSLLSMAFYLAAIAAPIALSYWLYNQDKD